MELLVLIIICLFLSRAKINYGILAIALRGNCPPIRVGVSVKVRLSFRVGGN